MMLAAEVLNTHETRRRCDVRHTVRDGWREEVSGHDDAKKDIVLRNIARDEQGKEEAAHLAYAFKSGPVWLLGAIYYSIASAIYIVSFWVPSIIKQTGVSDPLTIGLLTAIPYIAAMVAMIWTNNHGDRMRERRWHTVIPGIFCGVGLALTDAARDSTRSIVRAPVFANAMEHRQSGPASENRRGAPTGGGAGFHLPGEAAHPPQRRCRSDFR